MEPRDASDIDGQNREVEWHAVLAGIFSRGKTGRSSRDSIYCPANCRALSSNNGSSPRSATRLTALCSFAITSLEWSEWMSDVEGKVTRVGASERGQRTSFKIGCCNFCKGLFLKAGWRWVDRNYGKEKAS